MNGMDRLRNARELTDAQQQFIDSLSYDFPLKRRYQLLVINSNDLWQQAQDHQQQQIGFFTTEELGQMMISVAHSWDHLKAELDEEMGRRE